MKNAQNDKQKKPAKSLSGHVGFWFGPNAARNYTIWLVIWIMIDFLVVTSVLTFAPPGPLSSQSIESSLNQTSDVN